MNLTTSLENIKKEAKRQAEIRNWNAPNLEYVVNQIIEDAYVAGFMRSGEGFNGEYYHPYSSEELKEELLQILTHPQGE